MKDHGMSTLDQVIESIDNFVLRRSAVPKYVEISRSEWADIVRERSVQYIFPELAYVGIAPDVMIVGVPLRISQ